MLAALGGIDADRTPRRGCALAAPSRCVLAVAPFRRPLRPVDSEPSAPSSDRPPLPAATSPKNRRPNAASPGRRRGRRIGCERSAVGLDSRASCVNDQRAARALRRRARRRHARAISGRSRCARSCCPTGSTSPTRRAALAATQGRHGPRVGGHRREGRRRDTCSRRRRPGVRGSGRGSACRDAVHSGAQHGPR